jgi:hypothetical protein
MLVYRNENALSRRPWSRDRVRLHMREELIVNALRSTPKSELTQGGKIARRKIVRQCPLGGGCHIDLAVMEPLDQIAGCDVDDLDVVGHVDDRIRNSLADTDAGDLGDDVVEAFDVLDIEGRINVDTAVEQFLDIEIALWVAAAFRIGMGEFVDKHERRAAGEDGVDVHFLKRLPAIVDLPAWDDFKTVDKRFGFFAAVGFYNADDHINSIGEHRAARKQHLIGLADTWRGAEKNLQSATRFRLCPLEKRFRRGPACEDAIIISHSTHPGFVSDFASSGTFAFSV